MAKESKRPSKKTTGVAGTNVGVSETMMEMAAEMIDPALWATMQLTKPDQPPAKTVGDIHDRIRAIMATAIEMAIRQRELSPLPSQKGSTSKPRKESK